MIKRIEFDELEIIEQLNYVNNELLKNTLRKISEEIGIDRNGITKRLRKIGYIYNTETKQYTKDNSIEVQPQQNIKTRSHKAIKRDVVDIKKVTQENIKEKVIPQYKECISEVAATQESLLDIQGITELLELKEQIKEVIQAYKTSKSIIDVTEQQELKLDKTKVNGDQKCRMIKIYDSVNNDWIKFAKENDEFKMQDLYSIALSECIEKYSK